MIEIFTEDVDVRGLKVDSLVRLAESAQPVVFLGIEENQAMFACLDPVQGIHFREYDLEGNRLANRIEYGSGRFEDPNETKKYLKMITGK